MSVTVQASKHPLKPDWVYADVEAGQSIYEIAGGAPVTAYINGREVAEDLHRLTKVKDGAHVVLWPVPQGGASDLLKSVAQIVVSAAAVAITGGAAAGLLGSAFAAGSFGAYALAGGVALAGNYAINALIPPPTPSQPNTPESFNRLESITGTSNQVAAFKPIPKLYGTFRMFPPIPMTARPYTEIVGDDQFLRMFLCLGYGPLEIGGKTVGHGYSKLTEQDNLSGTPIKIGETDIQLFEEVEYEIGSPDQMTIYSDQIIESDPAFSTSENDDGEFAIRTTETDVDEISISLAGQLFGVNDKAKTRRGTVRWRIEYREVGTTNFIVEEEDFVVNSSKKETVRVGYRFKVPKGQYEVKLTRKSTSFAADTSTAADFTWNALRSIRSVQPFNVEGTVCMALRIKATDQLNGRIDDLSVEATSVLDVYDGTSWNPQPTNNPAWVYADIWTGNANRRPISKSDLDENSLLGWANYCDQEGFRYNGVFDSSGTTFDRATEVAQTGLANWNFSPDAKIGVVRDVAQSVPKMIISPRNSFGFNYELAAVQVPDALRVRFVDSATYENTERLVFDDGFDESNAQKYETLEAKGVTDPDQAWKFGRYHLAQQRLRPERYNFKQDVQHLRYQRGDMLTIQYDTILVGLGAGRIKEVVSNREIVIDELFVDDGKDYGVKIQRQDGTVSTVSCRLGEGPLNQTILLNSDVEDLNPDDLVIFGEVGRESIDVKVTAIEPEGNLIARVTTVPAADEIEQAWDADIPPFDPVLTAPVSPDLTSPKRPTISRIRSDENALYVDSDGSLRVRMLVDTALESFPGWDQLTQLRYRPVGDTQFETLDPVRGSSISIFDVDEGIEYEVQARGVKSGKFSPWTDSKVHTVVGKTTPPPNVQNFQAYQNGESVVFRWQEITTVPDIEGYEVRYGPRQKATWNNSVKIAETTKTNVVTEADVPPGDFKFFVKAVDTSGNYSETAAEKDLVVKTEFELLEQTEHSPDWNSDGYFIGFEEQDGVLVATNNEEAYFVADEVDLGFDAENVRVWAEVDASLEIYDDLEDYGSIVNPTSSIENYQSIADSATTTEDYGALATSLPVSDPLILYQISYRNTGEDLSGFDSSEDYGSVTQEAANSADYGLITDDVTEFESYDTLAQWENWTRGEIDARYVRQRIKIQRRPGEVGLKTLRSFKTSVDAPERTEKQQALTVAPGGSTFQFNRPFHLIPTVTGTVESDQALFPIRKSLSKNSVTFVVRDSNGNDVGADNFDLIAIGA